jgi:hypothetical protein
MMNQRHHMAAIDIDPNFEKDPMTLRESQQIYCIGGKGKFLTFKSIEKYWVGTDCWTELKIQLNHTRYFPSCTKFRERLIYIFGQLSE